MCSSTTRSVRGRDATPDRWAAAAPPVRASSRGSVRQDTARTARSTHRSRGRAALVETPATRTWCRCGCWRDARPRDFRDGIRAPEQTGRPTRNRQHEDAKDVGAVRGKRVRLGSVTTSRAFRAASPRPTRAPAGAGRVAFGAAGIDPSLDHPDLRICERMLSDERTVGRIRLPRRHVPVAR